jgi:hypothetical protein
MADEELPVASTPDPSVEGCWGRKVAGHANELPCQSRHKVLESAIGKQT